MMDSTGRIHMLEEIEPTLQKSQAERLEALERSYRHTGFVTKEPMPEACNPRKVLSALEKLADATAPIASGDAALLPLTPFERGYVLGVLAEYRAWRAGR